MSDHDDAHDTQWQRRDVWLGALFLVVGGLMITYAILARRNDVPFALWGTCVWGGPVLVLLGVNALVRSLRAGR